MKPIRVLIVDDHTLFRSGIKVLLQYQKAFEVVGEAANGRAGANLAKSLRPDVVLLDLHMPGISGREALQIIVEQEPQTRVVMLTASEDAEEMFGCLRDGATGYLLKYAAIDHLSNAILCAARGESFISPQMTGWLEGKETGSVAAPVQALPAILAEAVNRGFRAAAAP